MEKKLNYSYPPLPKAVAGKSWLKQKTVSNMKKLAFQSQQLYLSSPSGPGKQGKTTFRSTTCGKVVYFLELFLTRRIILFHVGIQTYSSLHDLTVLEKCYCFETGSSFKELRISTLYSLKAYLTVLIHVFCLLTKSPQTQHATNAADLKHWKGKLFSVLAVTL